MVEQIGHVTIHAGECRAVGIELNPAYVQLIRERLAPLVAQGALFVAAEP